ncbi:MAG: AMP-binding protein [Acidimicrobiia bacterium]
MASRFSPMGTGVLTSEERHPLLSEAGRRALQGLLEAVDAPRWDHHTGDRLDAAGRRRVETLAAMVVTDPPRWPPQQPPAWVAPFVDHAVSVVPRYRSAAAALGTAFTTSRHDLARAWWDLVPDDADLGDLIWFPTSGTGGTPVVVPTHPEAVASYYPLLLEAARWHGVDAAFRPDRADWVTVFAQGHGGFVVPSWSSVLGCATAKVNLEPTGWRAPGDRERFLQRHDPRVITGDPVAFGQLADLDIELHPAVLISTAAHLTTTSRRLLTDRFGCPVVDVYSLTESGPVAASRPGGAGMAVLQPRLYVETVDDDGLPCPPGTAGTVALTGGINPFLPLVRYRTSDTAVLAWDGERPVLHDLVGRASVTLRAAGGTAVNSIDITLLFSGLPLRRWAVRQRADGSVEVDVEAEGAPTAGVAALVTEAVRTALGPVPVTVGPLTEAGKVVPFRTEE